MFTTPAERYSFKVTSPPVAEPIGLSEVKAALGIDPGDTSRDARLTNLIRAGRELAESFTGRAFITQGLTLQLDGWPIQSGMPWWGGIREGSRAQFSEGAAPLSLPRPPLVSVQSVQYRQADGSLATLDPALYSVDAITEPGRLILDPGALTVTGRASFVVMFTAGYGSSPADVPAVVGEAILAHIVDAMQRPNAGVSSERVDNASVTYGGSSTASGAAAATGLRGGAADMLTPLRLRRIGS